MARSGIISSKSGWDGASYAINALRAFIPMHASADLDLARSRETIALRARNLFQNHSFSRALVNSFDVNVVGSGVRVMPVLKNYDRLGLTLAQAEDWAKDVRILYETWCNSLKCDCERANDMYGLQDLAIKTQLAGGECFALTKYFSKREPFGLCIKLLEGERVANPLGVFDGEEILRGVSISEGVEFDVNGCPVAYNFTKNVPYSFDSSSYLNFETVRVPAYDKNDNPNVIHLYVNDRPDQHRGISMLAPIILDMKQADRVKDAHLMKALINAMLTAFIENSSDEAPDAFAGDIPEAERTTPMDENGNVPGTNDAAPCEMGSGNIIELGKGQTIKGIESAKPGDGYRDFSESIFAEAAAACGVSYEVVLHKFNSSYNAVRAAILESKKSFDKMRRGFISKFCRPIYEKWLENMVMTGVIAAPGFDDPLKRSLWCDCNWVADSAFLLDPQKETAAIKMQLDEQLTDRDSACAALYGVNYAETARKLADQKMLRAEIGLQEPGAINKTESFSVSTDDVEQSDL